MTGEQFIKLPKKKTLDLLQSCSPGKHDVFRDLVQGVGEYNTNILVVKEPVMNQQVPVCR